MEGNGQRDRAFAYIGLGSNLDDREGLLAQAVRLLHEPPALLVEACSSIYETDPVGYLDQPAFLNQVIRVSTSLSPLELYAKLAETEAKLGRKREVRWGPRTIDLDLLLYGDETVDLPELTVPHPRMTERAFVLIPLQDVYLSDRLPQAGLLGDVLENMEGKEGVKRWIKKL